MLIQSILFNDKCLNPICRALIATVVTGFVSACHAEPPAKAALPEVPASSTTSASAETNPKLQALLDKTLKNLRFVEGGSFQMGDFGPIHSPEKLPYSTNPNNKPLHPVKVDSFSMSAFKTTYAEHDIYSEVMGVPLVGTDHLTKEHRYPNAAAGLKWRQARDYCQWLGRQLKLAMDLPTEAQWEYAARNRGQMLLFATDNGEVEPGRNVWEYEQRNDYIEKNGLGVYNPSLPLGQFPATPLGLYDMMTDGFEWMLDWYDPHYYANSPESNPRGPSNSNERVLRSSRGSSGKALAYGDGLTITRSHRQPDPLPINARTLKPDSTSNMTGDTAARCVANNRERLPAAP
jgi:formylglycine-generating enzyme required for sulfatase activity